MAIIQLMVNAIMVNAILGFAYLIMNVGRVPDKLKLIIFTINH